MAIFASRKTVAGSDRYTMWMGIPGH